MSQEIDTNDWNDIDATLSDFDDDYADYSFTRETRDWSKFSSD